MQKLKYLALGDSYTVGEGVNPGMSWPIRLAGKLEDVGFSVSTTVIAKTGWRTDQLIDSMNKYKFAAKYDLISILIGVNNQYQGQALDEFKTDVEKLLKRALSLSGQVEKNIFVLSLPDYALTPFGQKLDSTFISREIAAYNRVKLELSKQFGSLFVHIEDLCEMGLSKPELLAPDGLHPSGKMYDLWVQRIWKLLGPFYINQFKI